MGVQITDECNYCGRTIRYTLDQMKYCSNERCQVKHERDYWRDYWFKIGMQEVDEFLKGL